MIRTRAIVALSVVVGVVWQSACGGDSPIDPQAVASVSLSANVVELIQGSEVQLEATLKDEAGGVVTGVTPQWSSDAPSVATVDENGMVRGESVGTTKIHATYGNASASADVAVLAPPAITVSETEVAMSVAEGGAAPDPRTLDVTNSGAGPLEGLSVAVEYPSDPTGWLTAELGGTSAPTTITLTVVTQGLQAGVHAASVSISSTTPGAGEVEVPVTLTLGALVIEESDGETTVSENGDTDDFTVALALQPSSNVVLTVSSGDEGEATVSPAALTFTPSDWNVAQTVTVTGVEDVEVDGDQVVDVTVAVDAAASDDAYDGATAVVAVTVADDDALGVTEDVPQGHPGVSADALVAAYDMSSLTTQGLLRDFSGNGLHGTIAGATPATGLRGGAYSFSGDPAERIALPSASVFDLDGPLTVAAWFRIDTPNQHQHVIACDDKFVLWLKASDQVRIANTRSDFGETVEPLSSGEFHSVVGIFKGTAGDQIDTSNLEIWVDGELVEITVGSAVSPPVWRDGVLYPTDACYIGFESHQGRADHADLGFYGLIDEVLVFGRALTPAEVALLAATTP